MVKKLASKIFWGIWILIGILVLVFDISVYLKTASGLDLGGVLVGSVILAMGIYVSLIYVGITVLIIIIWLITKLIKKILK